MEREQKEPGRSLPTTSTALQGATVWWLWTLQLQSSEGVVVPSKPLPLAPCAVSYLLNAGLG